MSSRQRRGIVVVAITTTALMMMAVVVVVISCFKYVKRRADASNTRVTAAPQTTNALSIVTVVAQFAKTIMGE